MFECGFTPLDGFCKRVSKKVLWVVEDLAFVAYLELGQLRFTLSELAEIELRFLGCEHPFCNASWKSQQEMLTMSF